MHFTSINAKYLSANARSSVTGHLNEEHPAKLGQGQPGLYRLTLPVLLVFGTQIVGPANRELYAVCRDVPGNCKKSIVVSQ